VHWVHITAAAVVIGYAVWLVAAVVVHSDGGCNRQVIVVVQSALQCCMHDATTRAIAQPEGYRLLLHTHDTVNRHIKIIYTTFSNLMISRYTVQLCSTGFLCLDVQRICQHICVFICTIVLLLMCTICAYSFVLLLAAMLGYIL
jgi:hypothetical protein